MKRLTVSVAVAITLSVCGTRADAACFPLKSEVVSLGEAAARAYAQRSLEKAVEDETRRIKGSGGEIGRVAKKTLDCKPFPNILGADEWRCVGEATVCSKG